MLDFRTMLRSTIACTLACGLLATATSGAAARPIDEARTSSLAGTTTWTPPRQDLRSPDTRDAARPERQDLRSPDARDAARVEQISRMMEAYYSTYEEPEPVVAPAPRAPAGESPWLLVSGIAAGLAVVLASAALVVRRRRVTGAATS
jgi:hypothetical protein